MRRFATKITATVATAIAAAMIALTLSPAPAGAWDNPDPFYPLIVGAVQAEMINLADAHHRAACGRGYTVEWPLMNAAQHHSQDMSDNEYFSHTDLAGRGVVSRVASSGGDTMRALGEVITMARNAHEAFGNWMNSAGHRRLIQDCTKNRLGVGWAWDGTQTYGYYTMVLAAG